MLNKSKQDGEQKGKGQIHEGSIKKTLDGGTCGLVQILSPLPLIFF